MKPINRLIEQLKQAEQDHEFYPTTDEILRALTKDIGSNNHRSSRHHNLITLNSVLDIGAGNGKVLRAIKDKCGFSHLHAIEKSSILCRSLPEDVLVVGTDFHQQSLLSKDVDVVFCNPPYREFEEWATKIIRESASHLVYLVIPVRWEKSIRIADAIKFRDATTTKVGTFDFMDAEDRTARAKVHLLRFQLEKDNADDAFDRFFREQFADLIGKFETPEPKEDEAKPDEHGFGALVVGPNYPEALVALYQKEMANVQQNYHLIGQLDVALLKEFEISPSKILTLLKAKMKGMRNLYWMELFSHLDTVTNRLTAKSRQSLLNTLHKHVQVDFTVSNILEIVLWVIKNANRYIDSQLIETYELMVAKCNVQLYKSNQRVWVEERWRYNSGEPEKNSHYALDYRIVTHRIGGIGASSYSSNNGLDERANEFMGDLLTLARNLGFEPGDGQRYCLDRWSRSYTWTSGTRKEFFDKQGDVLFDVRAFQNGNLHLRLHKDFILALNVEHGRLKGWLKTAKEAAEELKDPKAAAYFNGNIQLGAGCSLMMLAPPSPETEVRGQKPEVRPLISDINTSSELPLFAMVV